MAPLWQGITGAAVVAAVQEDQQTAQAAPAADKEPAAAAPAAADAEMQDAA
jgi:hypothetical protein